MEYSDKFFFRSVCDFHKRQHDRHFGQHADSRCEGGLLRSIGKENVLSMIILDNTSATDEIPSDAQGRFIDSSGTVFQGYYLNDSQIDWEAQI